MNDRRGKTSWILFGALALAGATALAVFTLTHAPIEPASVSAVTSKPAPPDSRDPSERPSDTTRAPDTRRTGEASTPIVPPTPIDPNRLAIRGDVHTTSGQPIAGAEIHIVLVEPDATRDMDGATSDASGRFLAPAKLVEDLDPARRGLAQIVATARASGFQAQKQQINLSPLSADSAAPLVFTFALKPGNTLSGRVVDKSMQPVRGAEVELIVPGDVAGRPQAAAHASGAAPKSDARAGKNVCACDKSGGDGRFVLNFVSSGTYQLAAREPNTGTAFEEKLELVADEDRVLKDVVLHGDGILAGRAQYPGGTPARSLELWAIPDWMANEPNALASVTLKAADLEHEDGLLYGRTTSDSDGHFRFAGLKPGNYALRSPRTEVVLEPRQARYVLGTENITIEVQSYRLLVHVKDAAGRPFPGAGIACAEMSLVQDGRLETVKVDHGRATGNEATATFEVDSDRTYALTASSPGCLSSEDLVILAPGEYEAQRDLVLQPAGAHGRLHLTLDGAPSESVSSMQISFFSALTEQRAEAIGVVSPDADGWISALPPGRYRLQVGFGARDGELSIYFPIPARDEVEIRAGASTEHVVRARPGARLRLVLDVDGSVKSSGVPNGSSATGEKQRERNLREHGATVRVACGPAGELRAVQFVEPAPEHPKHFLLASLLLPGESALIADLLEPGDCTVHVEAPGYQSAEAPVSLRAGPIQELRIALVRK